MLITRSLPTWIFTGLLTAITSGALVWAAFGHYTRSETVSGSIIPTGVLSKVYADKAGRVTWLGVKEGDVVPQGQPIATVRTEQDLEGGGSPDSQRLASVADQVRLISQELSFENGRAAKERLRLDRLIRYLGAERSEMNAHLKLQKDAVVSTRLSFDAMNALLNRGFETRTDVEQRRQAWLAAAADLQSLIQEISQLEERRSEAEADLAKLPEDHAGKVADLHNTLNQLDQHRIDIEGARAFTITAPITGRVTSIQAMVGRSTEGRLPLLTIIPLNARMEATLYAPSRAIGMARTGQQVRLMYDAFPYQRFGSFTGRIIRISQSVLAPDEVDTPIKLQEPVYQIRVALDQQQVRAFGQILALSPGMTLTADIALDRRSFLDWMLEPVRAIRSRA